MRTAFKKPANRRRNRVARKRYAKKKATVSKPVRKAITTVIKQHERATSELKYVLGFPASLGGSVLNSYQGFSQAITNSNELYKLIPNTSQGDASHQRDGDVINPTSLVVKGRVVLNNRIGYSAGVFVHVYILTSKACKSWEAAGNSPDTVPISRLLNNGDSTKTTFTGSFFNSMLKVNEDDFNIIKHDIIHLVKGVDNYNAAQNLSTSAFPYPTGQNGRSFSYRIPLPKKLIYSNIQGVATNQPNNTLPFMVIGWTWDDSYGDTISNFTDLVQVEAQSHMYFRDPS